MKYPTHRSLRPRPPRQILSVVTVAFGLALAGCSSSNRAADVELDPIPTIASIPPNTLVGDAPQIPYSDQFCKEMSAFYRQANTIATRDDFIRFVGSQASSLLEGSLEVSPALLRPQWRTYVENSLVLIRDWIGAGQSMEKLPLSTKELMNSRGFATSYTAVAGYLVEVCRINPADSTLVLLARWSS